MIAEKNSKRESFGYNDVRVQELKRTVLPVFDAHHELVAVYALVDGMTARDLEDEGVPLLDTFASIKDWTICFQDEEGLRFPPSEQSYMCAIPDNDEWYLVRLKDRSMLEREVSKKYVVDEMLADPRIVVSPWTSFDDWEVNLFYIGAAFIISMVAAGLALWLPALQQTHALIAAVIASLAVMFLRYDEMSRFSLIASSIFVGIVVGGAGYYAAYYLLTIWV